LRVKGQKRWKTINLSHISKPSSDQPTGAEYVCQVMAADLDGDFLRSVLSFDESRIDEYDDTVVAYFNAGSQVRVAELKSLAADNGF